MVAAKDEQLVTSPAAASTAVADLITSPAQPAEIIADFPVARYFRVGESVIALVTPPAVRLPNALVCSELPPPTTPVITGTSHTQYVRSAGDHGIENASVLVGDGCVRLGGVRVTIGRWWDPVPRLPTGIEPSTLTGAIEAMRARLPGWPGSDESAAEQLVAGRAALVSALAGEREPADVADQLVGLGPGLTPAGDDLLAGAVAGLVIFGGALGRPSAVDLARRVAAAVTDKADRTTVLAADLARHAATGAVAEPVAHVCRALAGQRSLDAAVDRLLAIGHTSGRDLAEGLVLGTAAAATERPNP